MSIGLLWDNGMGHSSSMSRGLPTIYHHRKRLPIRKTYFEAWCTHTKCRNLREHLNTHHPLDYTGNVHSGSVGVVCGLCGSNFALSHFFFLEAVSVWIGVWL